MPLPEPLDNPETMREIQARARAYADFIKLPFRNQIWRGQSGDFLGAGVGSSLDFQDHRSYVPGDDPRHINWQAYARTGHYTMKLYREEVRPMVDLVLDASASMFFDPAKARRVAETFYYAAESALRSGAALRAHLLAADQHRPLSDEAIFAHAWGDLAAGLKPAAPSLPPRLDLVPFRQGSMRILISDLLFPGNPEPFGIVLAQNRGRGMIFAPFCQAEAKADWQGNYEFVDSETRLRHQRRVEPSILKRYRAAYLRHFELWKSAAVKHGVLLARIPAEPAFQQAMQAEAIPFGAVELAG